MFNIYNVLQNKDKTLWRMYPCNICIRKKNEPRHKEDDSEMFYEAFS